MRLTIAKSAALAPNPIASVSTTAALNPGVLISERMTDRIVSSHFAVGGSRFTSQFPVCRPDSRSPTPFAADQRGERLTLVVAGEAIGGVNVGVAQIAA